MFAGTYSLRISVLLLAGVSLAAGAKETVPLEKHTSAEHAVDRLSFGALPGQVSQVESMGVDRWIDLQLNPEKIDDSALDVRLAQYPAMKLNLHDLMVEFPANNLIRAITLRHASNPMPHSGSDAIAVQAIYNVKIAELKQKLSNPPDASSSTESAATQPVMNIAALQQLSPTERYNAILALEPASVHPFFTHLSGRDRQALNFGMTPKQKEVLIALEFNPERVIAGELQQERLIRAVYSSRQLNEVMINFWLNHFSIYLHKNQEEPYYLTSFERDVIRPHAMGKFEDLLNAVAHSPAMLVYLDNQLSIGPDSAAVERKPKKNGGLNENYARELMELHTLGVNGGYSQADVIQVARALTGWGVNGRHSGDPVHDTFEFNKNHHEPGDKIILGKQIHENGELEGVEVLHLLAESPATAHFLSTKLATQFVSDNPPPALVDRMAKTYRKTHGNIREVLRTMFRAKEFWSGDVYRVKLKTPLEFVASSLRATGAQVENAGTLVASLDRLGMPLYGAPQPNGFSLRADPWLGSEALLARMNFALALTSNRVNGVHVNLSGEQPSVAGNTFGAASVEGTDTGAEEAQLEDTLMDGQVTTHTHEAVLKQMSLTQMNQVQNAPITLQHSGAGSLQTATSKPQAKPLDPLPFAAALLLGSPDFQRR